MLAAVFLVVVGVGVTTAFVWLRHRTTTEVVTSESAEITFEAVLERHPDPPLVVRTESGWERGVTGSSDTPPSVVHVLGYRARGGELVRAELPFWFVKMKSPALAFVTKFTRFNIEEVGLTADDLARHGAGVVVHDTRPNGDRLLVWLE